MITIYEKLAGKVIGCQQEFEETELYGVTSELCTDTFIIPYFNSLTNEFYEGATSEEIENYENSITVDSVTRFQLKKQLILDGKTLDQVTSYIENLSYPEKDLVYVVWNDSHVFNINDESVLAITTILGYSGNSLRTLFINASKL